MRKKAIQLGFIAIGIIFILPYAEAQNFLRINQKDGKLIEIPLSDIRKLTLTDIASLAPEQKAQITGAVLKFNTFPNPATDLVNIKYSLAIQGNVTIEVYNIKGTLMFSSIQGNQDIGDYCFKWNTGNSASGTYLCCIRQNNKLLTEKIILNK